MDRFFLVPTVAWFSVLVVLSFQVLSSYPQVPERISFGAVLGSGWRSSHIVIIYTTHYLKPGFGVLDLFLLYYSAGLLTEMILSLDHSNFTSHCAPLI